MSIINFFLSGLTVSTSLHYILSSSTFSQVFLGLSLYCLFSGLTTKIFLFYIVESLQLPFFHYLDIDFRFQFFFSFKMLIIYLIFTFSLSVVSCRRRQELLFFWKFVLLPRLPCFHVLSTLCIYLFKVSIHFHIFPFVLHSHIPITSAL